MGIYNELEEDSYYYLGKESVKQMSRMRRDGKRYTNIDGEYGCYDARGTLYSGGGKKKDGLEDIQKSMMVQNSSDVKMKNANGNAGAIQLWKDDDEYDTDVDISECLKNDTSKLNSLQNYPS